MYYSFLISRVQTAKQFLKGFPKYNQRRYAYIATGDETWVYYFEPVGKIGNKISLTKHGRRYVSL